MISQDSQGARWPEVAQAVFRRPKLVQFPCIGSTFEKKTQIADLRFFFKSVCFLLVLYNYRKSKEVCGQLLTRQFHQCIYVCMYVCMYV